MTHLGTLSVGPKAANDTLSHLGLPLEWLRVPIRLFCRKIWVLFPTKQNSIFCRRHKLWRLSNLFQKFVSMKKEKMSRFQHQSQGHPNWSPEIRSRRAIVETLRSAAWTLPSIASSRLLRPGKIAPTLGAQVLVTYVLGFSSANQEGDFHHNLSCH